MSNLDYFYEHLPSRFRRDDEDLFLRRFLSFFGETLDGWDAALDNFWQQIQPATASAEFVEWWLYVLFGWSWFPRWFTLADKRNLYARFAQHLARRGTRRGIELWLLDFGIVARVASRPRAYDDDFYGEGGWLVDEPLTLIVEILGYKDRVNIDRWFYGESWYGGTRASTGAMNSPPLYYAEGESYYTNSETVMAPAEIEELLRFVWPAGQEMFVVWAAHEPLTGN
jgi:phage tail-like protein